MSSTNANKKSITKRIVIGVAITLALVFIVFLFITTNFLGNNMIVTETAYRATAYDVVKTNAIVVRDEVDIKKEASGVMVYDVTDGDKVTANGTIATVYQNEEDVVKMQRIEELEEKIDYLESLNTSVKSTNIGLDTINSRLNENLVTLIKTVNAGSFDYIDSVEDELMSAVFRKQIVTGEQGRFDDQIADLKAELEELKQTSASPAGTIKSTDSGYFVSVVDGYEGCVDIKNLDSFYYSDFKDLEPAQVDESAYVGKVIRGVNWYLMCPVTHDEAVNISHNTESVSVRMPYALNEDIPARVMYVNNLKDEDKAIVVLRCNYMSDALSKIRKENVEIVVGSYEGLKISKSAIHDAELTRTVEDEGGKEHKESKVVQGVYVKYGNELRFKQIIIDYSGDDYVICDDAPDGKMLFKGSTVLLYDQVVVEGGDLFDGKLIR